MLHTYIKEMDYTIYDENEEMSFETKLERAKNVWDFQFGLEYLDDRANDEEFYVEWVTGATLSDCTEMLIYICKGYFNELEQEEKDRLLKAFCFDDEHDYVEWYENIYGLNL